MLKVKLIMKEDDNSAINNGTDSDRVHTQLDSSKRELLKKAWIAPAAVTIAALPLSQVEAGTTAPP